MAFIDNRDFRKQTIFRQIGAKIAYYRALRNMKQTELAEAIHIDKSVLSRIERGKYHNNISVSMLIAIAEGLNIAPALLLTFTEIEKKLWWDDDSDEAIIKDTTRTEIMKQHIE